MATLDLALVETEIGPDYSLNFEHAVAGVRRALDARASLVVLPELCVTGFGKKAIGAYLEDESRGSSALIRLAQECRTRQAALVYGGPELAKSGRYYNCLYFPGTDGLLQYRKFMVYTDVEVNFESAVGRTSPNVVAFTHQNSRGENFVVGVQLCADLRFPEVARASAEAGATIIINASQWRDRPRLEDHDSAYPEHWELLLRCRAIENQVYFAGCGATGTAREYHLHGHSMVSDPLGQRITPVEEMFTENRGAKVLLYQLDMGQVGGKVHRQAEPFLPWMARARGDIELAGVHTRELVASARAGHSRLPSAGASKVLRALRRFRECCHHLPSAPQDERAVQDLVWIILRAQFDDLLREESLSIFGAKSYRPDFGVPSARTLVEVKYLRNRSALSNLQDAILADVPGYLANSSAYNSLIVLVYDAAGGLLDSTRFCRDMEGIEGVAGVVVIPTVDSRASS